VIIALDAQNLRSSGIDGVSSSLEGGFEEVAKDDAADRCLLLGRTDDGDAARVEEGLEV